MPRTLCVLVLLCVAFPSVIFGQDAPPETAANGAIFRSGIAAVQRLESQASAAQMQHTRLKMDRTTKIVLIAAAAVAAIVWFDYALKHAN